MKTHSISLKIDIESVDQLKLYAKNNARTLSEEIIARLNVTLKENEKLMAQDRLMRLIFCKKLAYKGKSLNRAHKSID